ncbi:MAG: aminoacyl-tRNA hydrolase [Catonella sp.]|nr:aminoacyl-tRNA hydrolase [Catonella sp.]MDY6356476.1 aminoacyl-tRNA hydrolase [Catonella sp.]
MYIIAGLGNPEARFAGTRHNAGFDAITALSDKYNIPLDRDEFNAKTGRGYIEGEKVLLMKPMTYMNNSGEAIGPAASFYKLDIENELIVIHDDIDLEPGFIRIRAKGSAGGHNGMKSIISHVGSESFTRIRIGVGKKPEGWDLADHVLARFPKDVEPVMRNVMKTVADAVTVIVTKNVNEAMNKFNGVEITGD